MDVKSTSLELADIVVSELSFLGRASTSVEPETPDGGASCRKAHSSHFWICSFCKSVFGGFDRGASSSSSFEGSTLSISKAASARERTIRDVLSVSGRTTLISCSTIEVDMESGGGSRAERVSSILTTQDGQCRLFTRMIVCLDPGGFFCAFGAMLYRNSFQVVFKSIRRK